MKYPWWQILLILLPLVFTIVMELIYSIVGGPTITWMMKTWLPQSLIVLIIGSLVKWLPAHFGLLSKKRESNGPTRRVTGPSPSVAEGEVQTSGTIHNGRTSGVFGATQRENPPDDKSVSDK